MRPPIRPGEPAPDFTLPAVMAPGEVSPGRLSPQEPRDALARSGVATVAVVNTQRECAALYFRYHPTRVRLLADPEARTHLLFGVPSVVPAEAFAAVRTNPTGELPHPMHPMEANAALNARDGFVMTEVDEAVFSAHGTQLAGHFLIGRDGIVRWTSIEAEAGIHTVAAFPSPAEVLAAARNLST